MRVYDVLLDNVTVGCVTVEEAGLYTTFSCSCDFPNSRPLRVMAFYEDRCVRIGVCLPEAGRFCCSRKIATKHLGKGIPVFRVMAAGEQIEEYGVLVEPHVPFTHISKLPFARLSMAGGSVRLLFRKSINSDRFYPNS